MRTFTWLFLAGLVCVTVTSCTKKESSDDATAQKQASEPAPAAAGPELAGRWEITGWQADEVDQFDMWRVGDVMVEFHPDGSIESKLVYDDGEERTSMGTWKRDGSHLEIAIQGGGEEGDEPFERTREFSIDELTPSSLVVHAEIGGPGKPIVLTYKAKRLP